MADRAHPCAASGQAGPPRPAPQRRSRRGGGRRGRSQAAPAPQAAAAAVEAGRAAPAQGPPAAVGLTPRQLKVKLGLASSLGRLDLSDAGLAEVPPQVFELEGLEDLTLAGNSLTRLPEALGALTSLRRLQLSGNQLERLPESLCRLTSLQGLWVQGNLLRELPQGIGALTQLEILAVAGNCLPELPAGVSQLVSLRELGCAGNQLRGLPEGLGCLGKLQKLQANGNLLERLPQDLGGLTSLTELALQANRLQELPPGLNGLGALRELNAADNRLGVLPSGLAALTALRTLTLYGNSLRELSAELHGMSALKGLWVEANPLSLATLQRLQQALRPGEGPPLLKVGLDTAQVSLLGQDAVGRGTPVGEIVGEGPGYFKLLRGAPDARGSLGPEVVTQHGRTGRRVLVVAFGSAPGVPNFGGLLGRVAAAAQAPHEACFDVLYVVDGARTWYSGGDEGWQGWQARLAEAARPYGAVLMLGDSMGATGACLAAPLATAVLVFSPQVSLGTASMRPGRPWAWLDALQRRLVQGIAECDAAVEVHVGNWQHDLDQVACLPQGDHVRVCVHGEDSHRLAAYLDRQGALLPLVRGVIAREMGLPLGEAQAERRLPSF